MSWSYAELSKLAKDNGGPEAYINKLSELNFNKGYHNGYSDGQSSMLPDIAGATAIGVVAGASMILGIQKLKDHLKNKRLQAEELEAVKSELINGIKEYDIQNSNTQDDESEVLENEPVIKSKTDL